MSALFFSEQFPEAEHFIAETGGFVDAGPGVRFEDAPKPVAATEG